MSSGECSEWFPHGSSWNEMFVPPRIEGVDHDNVNISKQAEVLHPVVQYGDSNLGTIFAEHGGSDSRSIGTDTNLGGGIGEAAAEHPGFIAACVALERKKDLLRKKERNRVAYPTLAYPGQDEGRDADAVEGAGEEVDHGGLAIPSPGEVADADDGDGEGGGGGGAALEVGEEAEGFGGGEEEGEEEGAVEEGETRDAGIRRAGDPTHHSPPLLHLSLSLALPWAFCLWAQCKVCLLAGPILIPPSRPPTARKPV